MRIACAVFALVLLCSPAPGQIVVQQTDLVSGPSGAQAQPPSKPGQLCIFEGSVVKSTTGEPVKKVIVSLDPVGGPGQQQHSVMTDARGQFSFRDIEPGRYALHSGGNGYPFQVYGQRSPRRRGKMFQLAPGSHEKDIIFRLTPGGVITGTVYDEEGDPAIGANVQALRKAGRSSQMSPAGGGQSNDRGEYRIYGLEPGQYYLIANYQIQGMSNNMTDEVYMPTFYPGTADPAQATALQVKGGDDLAAIDLNMTRVHGMRVHGRIASETGFNQQRPYVQLIPRAARGGFGFANYGAPVQDDKGNFEIQGVPPGSYYAFSNWGDGKKSYSGRAPVEVENADVDGVVLVLGPGFDVRGRVRADPGGQLNFAQLNIWLQPTGNQSMGGSPAEIKSDGTFVFHNLYDGDYQVRVGGFPEEYYLKSARLGGADVLVSGLSLSATQSAGTLDLELTLAGGTVTGTVLNDQKPAPGALVVLVPDPPNRNRDELYSSKIADQFGKFAMPGLPPGDFKLFAWELTEGGIDVRDPDILKLYEAHGTSVQIKEKQQQNVQLELIPAEEEPQ